MSLYSLDNRTLLVATQHQKEKAIAPFFKKHWSLHVLTTDKINTDSLGTFTGEIDRTLSPLEAARAKCILGLELGRFDLVVANEGSFFPDPTAWMLTVNEEVMYLMDTVHDIELSVVFRTYETNFTSELIHSESELEQVLGKIQFPEHAVIVKSAEKEIVKGISDWIELTKVVRNFLRKGPITIESDMRAMNNPTRMAQIEKATKKLVDAYRSSCPSCNKPGFQIVDARRGLPCTVCGFPTSTPIKFVKSCRYCGNSQEENNSYNGGKEDPMYCDRCNP